MVRMKLEGLPSYGNLHNRILVAPLFFFFFFFLTLFREETKTCIFFEDMRCVSFGSQVVAVMNYDSVFNLTT